MFRLVRLLRNLTGTSIAVFPRCLSTLHWRHNDHDSVSNHQPHDCLLNRLFRRRSKKISKLRVTGRWVGNSPVTGEFPAPVASNAENVSIWWRHHECFRGACQITKRCNDLNYKSCSFETSRDLTIRCLIGYSNGNQVNTLRPSQNGHHVADDIDISNLQRDGLCLYSNYTEIYCEISN